MSSSVVQQPEVDTGEDEEPSIGDSNLEDVRGGGSVPESPGEERNNDGVLLFGCQSKNVGETSSKAGGIRNNGIFLFRSGGNRSAAGSKTGGPTLLRWGTMFLLIQAQVPR
ncbi:hypothetical protein Hanom_Chr03g00232951 [Helianthus anomalus]